MPHKVDNRRQLLVIAQNWKLIWITSRKSPKDAEKGKTKICLIEQ